ncbi:MAG: STAS domain-containing protein [Acidimicrobiales bacterium]
MSAVPSAASNNPARSTTGADGFSLRFSRDGGQVVVEVGGDLDRSSTPLLLDPLLDVIEAQGNHSIALDLDGVKFMDSGGLHALVSIHRLLDTLGGTLVLRRPAPAVRRLLKAMGMYDVLTVVPLQASSREDGSGQPGPLARGSPSARSAMVRPASPPGGRGSSRRARAASPRTRRPRPGPAQHSAPDRRGHGSKVPVRRLAQTSSAWVDTCRASA